MVAHLDARSEGRRSAGGYAGRIADLGVRLDARRRLCRRCVGRTFEWSWYQSRLVHIPAGVEPTTIYSTARQIGAPQVAPDGSGVAFLECTWSDRGHGGGDVLLLPLGGGTPRNMTQDSQISAGGLAWSSDSHTLFFAGYEQGDATIGALDTTTGERRTLWREPVGLAGGARSPLSRAPATGTIAVGRDDAHHPLDVWVAQPSGDSARSFILRLLSLRLANSGSCVGSLLTAGRSRGS